LLLEFWSSDSPSCRPCVGSIHFIDPAIPAAVGFFAIGHRLISG
jgi:hypothetical protein